jgi:hypothetical protein
MPPELDFLQDVVRIGSASRHRLNATSDSMEMPIHSIAKTFRIAG